MHLKQYFAFLAVAVPAAIPFASATFWIFGGTRPIVDTRIDSVISPGVVSSHLHSVAGGSRFSATYNYDDLITSQCSTIVVPTDKSNYWTPKLYYRDLNANTFTPIPNSFNIYYLARPGPNNDKVHAFPTGLRMLAGDPLRRVNNGSNHADQAISYVCLDYNNNHSGDPDWAERPDFFPHQCPDGMRAQVFFPTCWDGVNLDSADHKSHMAYPIENFNDGSCPSTHPVKLVSLFYEMFVSVDQFPYAPGAWVWSFGDDTGLGFHGDFVDGWQNKTVLQSALDTCGDVSGILENCPVFEPLINNDAASACKIDGEIVNEPIGTVSSPLAQLPGCNPMWVGTGPKPTCNPPRATPGFINPQNPLPSGWTEVACIAEGTTGRALTAASTTNSSMTKPLCANYCAGLGYKLAGVEYGDECYCGNTLVNGANSTARTWYECSVTCAGNPNENCGGPMRLNLLQKN
ncbi:WSC-domain-containing protein [Irpex rosettiformis]|uniref:WSC-domain-containing protein n=1 Tax=Irpex rosettiformis TaxID=378272 RepID=A0ACB8U3M1_9APHY|nr:WSC-domain-containing protein [Irpex rosettiformis]